MYLSRDAGGALEIEAWTTQDGGETWTAQAVTARLGHQERPAGLATRDAALRG